MTRVCRRAIAACVLGLGLLPGAADAHVTATGLAVVTIAGRTVSYRLTVVPAELPKDAEQLLAQAMAGSRPDAERLAGVMRRAVVVRVDGQACEPGRVAIRDAGAALKAQLDYSLSCPAAPGRLELEENWTEPFGEHYQTIATIRTAAGGGEHVLGPGSPRAAVAVGHAGPGSAAGFVRLGVEHILTGYDHLLFLLALLLGARNIWRGLGLASMFTLAHSITLSLAVLGVVSVAAAIVEPLIAASIVWVAVENLVAPRATWRRDAVTFAFGLVHGLGFADALTPLGLEGWPLARALVGFNLGVELGQAIAIAAVLPGILVIGRLSQARLIHRGGSVAVAAAGAYWLVQRISVG